MLAQSSRGEQNIALAIQRSFESMTLRARVSDENKPSSPPSRLRQPKVNTANKYYRSTASPWKPADFIDKDPLPVSMPSFVNKSTSTRKTGIPVLTSLRQPKNSGVKPVIATAEPLPVLKSVETDVSAECGQGQKPEPAPLGPTISAMACKELISEVEQILSRTLLKGVVFGSMMEASKNKSTILLEDELSDIILDTFPIAEPETLAAIAEDSDLEPEAVQPPLSATLVHRRNSNNTTLDSVNHEDTSSRQSSRSRSYRKSRSRRSRRQYVIPVNASYKCSTPVITEQPKLLPPKKPTPDPRLDLKTLGSLFSFGTEELDKLDSVFIQTSDRFCGKFWNLFQDLMPSLSRHHQYDVFHDEISYPKFTVTKTRNPWSCFFADCENLNFAITFNQIPETHANRLPSILVECKECPAFDCSLHTASIYICNGTMKLGTCEHLSCNKDNPIMVLKNELMHETMVIRPKAPCTRWTDAQFWIFKLDEESNDPFDEERDGGVVAHIARTLPKVISPATFNRPEEVWPEQERITLTFWLSLDSFTKALILGASLLLKHDILS